MRWMTAPLDPKVLDPLAKVSDPNLVAKWTQVLSDPGIFVGWTASAAPLNGAANATGNGTPAGGANFFDPRTWPAIPLPALPGAPGGTGHVPMQ
jgi:hypothetical protein